MSVYLQILAQQNYLLYIFENDYFIGFWVARSDTFVCHLNKWYESEIQHFEPLVETNVPARQKEASICVREYLSDAEIIILILSLYLSRNIQMTFDEKR